MPKKKRKNFLKNFPYEECIIWVGVIHHDPLLWACLVVSCIGTAGIFTARGWILRKCRKAQSETSKFNPDVGWSSVGVFLLCSFLGCFNRAAKVGVVVVGF